MKINWLKPGLCSIQSLLSPRETPRLLADAIRCGFQEQVFHPPHIPEIRFRAMGDFPDWAGLLFGRLTPVLPAFQPFLPQNEQTRESLWQPIGVNERFRFYRYDTFNQFAPHQDYAFVRSDDEQTWLSLVVYLNTDFEGGETRFEDLTVRPTQGGALVYPHPFWHEGAIVLSGQKIILRSDILYRRRF